MDSVSTEGHSTALIVTRPWLPVDTTTCVDGLKVDQMSPVGLGLSLPLVPCRDSWREGHVNSSIRDDVSVITIQENPRWDEGGEDGARLSYEVQLSLLPHVEDGLAAAIVTDRLAVKWQRCQP